MKSKDNLGGLLKSLFTQATRPIRAQYEEQWQQGVFRDLSPAINYAQSAFGPEITIINRTEMRAYLTNSKMDTPFDSPPKPDSDRLKFAEERIVKFVSSAKVTFFNIEEGQPIPDNTNPELVRQFATRVFDVINVLNPKGLTPQGQWEQSIGPLIFTEVIAQSSNTSNDLAWRGVRTPDDHLYSALTKELFDRVPETQQEQWMRTIGEYSKSEASYWVRCFDKLDDRGVKVQNNFLQWHHQGVTRPKGLSW
jgi:hypothetical protein